MLASSAFLLVHTYISSQSFGFPDGRKTNVNQFLRLLQMTGAVSLSPPGVLSMSLDPDAFQRPDLASTGPHRSGEVRGGPALHWGVLLRSAPCSEGTKTRRKGPRKQIHFGRVRRPRFIFCLAWVPAIWLIILMKGTSSNKDRCFLCFTHLFI